MLEFKDEISTFTAHQVAERRRLMRKSGNRGGNVSCQFTGGDHAVIVQVSATVETLKQGPGEDGMSIGTIIGDLLVSSSGSKHLAGATAGNLLKIVGGATDATAARESQSAVAGIHDEKEMLCRNGFRNVLKIGHGYGLSLIAAQVGIHRNDVTKVTA